MPAVLRSKGFKFFFYSNEGKPLKAAHIHVLKSGREAKFWLRPSVRLARNDGFDAVTIRELLEFVEAHRADFEEAWDEFFT